MWKNISQACLIHTSVQRAAFFWGFTQRRIPNQRTSLESFIYPTDAQLDCSKNVKIYITIYMRGVPTCFGILQPSSGSYYTYI
jgi:hypothetical protein